MMSFATRPSPVPVKRAFKLSLPLAYSRRDHPIRLIENAAVATAAAVPTNAARRVHAVMNQRVLRPFESEVRKPLCRNDDANFGFGSKLRVPALGNARQLNSQFQTDPA
jgi:hypothetical protein